MKKITLAALALAFYCSTNAQAHIDKVEYQKTNHEAVVTDIPFPEKTVTNALKDILEKMGYKGKSSKGFTVYQGVKLAELGPDAYDLYFSIDRKSRKEKDNASVSL